jgi:hypothetical protein
VATFLLLGRQCVLFADCLPHERPHVLDNAGQRLDLHVRIKARFLVLICRDCSEGDKNIRDIRMHPTQALWLLGSTMSDACEKRSNEKDRCFKTVCCFAAASVHALNSLRGAAVGFP